MRSSDLDVQIVSKMYLQLSGETSHRDRERFIETEQLCEML